MTQQRSHFFLDVDDDVRLTQIFGQTCILAAQLLVLLIQRMALGLRAARLRVSASRMPLARSRRQVASSDEYKPSRRSREPTPPRVAAAASASCRMPSLYSAV